MLTVIVGFDGSGKSTTRRPFASRYSVIPSTEVTRSTPGGRGGASAAWAARPTSKKQKKRKTRSALPRKREGSEGREIRWEEEGGGAPGVVAWYSSFRAFAHFALSWQSSSRFLPLSLLRFPSEPCCAGGCIRPRKPV